MAYSDQSGESDDQSESNKRQRTEPEKALPENTDDLSEEVLALAEGVRPESNKRQRTKSDPQSKKIFLRMTKTITIEVADNNTVDDIKNIVEQLEGIAPSNQKLFFGRTHLKGTSTLDDHNIAANSCIDVFVKEGIKITVQNDTLSVSLNVKLSDTVSHVKILMLGKGTTTPDEEVALFFSYKKLCDANTLGSCGVHHNSVLQMVVQRNKGMLVTVELIDGSRIQLQLQSRWTISNVKDILGIPKDSLLKLFHSEHELEQHKTLRQYKITNNALLKVRL